MQTSNKTELEKFTATDILTLLPKMGYQGIYAETESGAPLFYEKESILVFPPVTDNPDPTVSTLKGIQSTVKQACASYPNILQNKKQLIFPLLEEQSYGFKPRRFWVVLMYDFEKNIISLIDPTGPLRASSYTSSVMEQALKASLSMMKLNVSPSLEKKYLSVQDRSDSVSSGHWVSYILYQFSQNASLSALITGLASKKPSIQDVSTILTNLLHHSSSECCEEGRDFYTAPTPNSDAFPAKQEKQDYAINMTAVHCPAFNIELGDEDGVMEHAAPQSGVAAYFQMNFYSTLMLSGMALVVLGIVCLTGQGLGLPLLGSAAMLGVGTLTFFSGLLGKCGLFDATLPALPTVHPGTQISHSI
ncbi:MAG: hypothetical protein CK424_07685 [Legionella sp.]|nr:MAG: hypothetical protein CK424_07685 [Legionella sp.]